MAVTTLRVRHRVCLRDRTAGAPAQYLRCPHASGRGDGQCFELVRRADGVYGVCTFQPLPWAVDQPGTGPWAVPQISPALFDRLAARVEPDTVRADSGLIAYVCVPEENAAQTVTHLFEIGHVQSVSTWPLDPEWGTACYQGCPGCGRTRDFVGSYDGHLLRVCCPCGEGWQPVLARDEADAAVRALRESRPGWLSGEGLQGESTLASVREVGTREGWFPALSAQQETVLDAALHAQGAVTVLGEPAARAALDGLVRALAAAEQVNDAAARHHARQRGAGRSRTV